MRTSISLLAATALVLPIVAGCAQTQGPRARPVKMGDVDTGTNSVEAVRRQLQGAWQLVTLQVAPPGGGSSVEVPATGHLNYDEYGNLSFDGKITEGAAQVDPAVLTLSGRAVIDPDKHMLRFLNVTGTTTAAEQTLDSGIDPAKVRYYEFVGELLKTTVKDASGATTATSTWKRLP